MRAIMMTAIVLLALPMLADAKIPKVQRIESGRVVGVTDGDTITVLIGQESIKVRLEGIDAPESKQDFGLRSKQHLTELVGGRSIDLHVTGRDRYGRTLGKLFAGDLNVNRQMLVDGLAWHYTQYNSEPGLADAETEARAERRGIWSDPSPIPPWEFRKQRK